LGSVKSEVITACDPTTSRARKPHSLTDETTLGLGVADATVKEASESASVASSPILFFRTIPFTIIGIIPISKSEMARLVLWR
jgi:hypothetical protein